MLNHPSFLLLLALAPVAAIIWFVYTKDEFDKEPTSLLVKSFLYGLLSIPLALAGEQLGEPLGLGISEDLWRVFGYAFFIVGLSEELAKYVFLRWRLFPKRDFDEPYDGIIYAVMIGMGFAAFENLLYVFNSDDGFSIAILRMFTAIPAHASFGVIMGYFVGMAKFDPVHKKSLLLQGLFWAVVAHGAYDFFIMQQNWPALGILTIVTLIAIIIFSQKAIKIHQLASPFHPDNIDTQETESSLATNELSLNDMKKEDFPTDSDSTKDTI